MDDAQKKWVIETLQEARALILNNVVKVEGADTVVITIMEAEVVVRQIEGAITALK